MIGDKKSEDESGSQPKSECEKDQHTGSVPKPPSVEQDKKSAKKSCECKG